MGNMLKRKKEIIEVFFAAMQSGYATSPKKSTIAELPCSRVIEFKKGDFRVVDVWFTAPGSSYSFGQTIIWYRNIPVWVMSYHGTYQDFAIPFLKAALRNAYDKNVFCGGRGSSPFLADGFQYNNRVDCYDWRDFRGREEVFHFSSNSRVGWHEYQGLLLID